jgi:hypothetical protein
VIALDAWGRDQRRSIDRCLVPPNKINLPVLAAVVRIDAWVCTFLGCICVSADECPPLELAESGAG